MDRKGIEMKKKLSFDERREIADGAILTGDIMTAFDFERMPVALLNGNSLDWLDDWNIRELWAELLQKLNISQSQFNIYARAAVTHGLFELQGDPCACGGGQRDLVKPLDFDARVDRFLGTARA